MKSSNGDLELEVGAELKMRMWRIRKGDLPLKNQSFQHLKEISRFKIFMHTRVSCSKKNWSPAGTKTGEDAERALLELGLGIGTARSKRVECTLQIDDIVILEKEI